MDNASFFSVFDQELLSFFCKSTATTTMKPLNASRRKGGTPMRLSRLFITAMISMPITVPVNINNHNVAGEFKEFFDVVVNNKPLAVTVHEGCNTIAACMAIMDSVESGKPVKPAYYR